jgi:DNA-binding PadR family transcriptional regulator
MSLRYGVLGLLAEQPLHGYQVRNRFEGMLGGTWDVNIGQVYSTLQRLERDGMVQTAGGRGDRGKLVYELTDLGRRDLESWLAEPDSGPQQLRQEVYVKLLLAARVANGGLPELLLKQKRAYL